MTMTTDASGRRTPFGHPLAHLARRLQERRRNARIRRGVRRLAGLDDATLQDIGVTRQEIAEATRLPLDLNPSVELHRISRARRARER